MKTNLGFLWRKGVQYQLKSFHFYNSTNSFPSPVSNPSIFSLLRSYSTEMLPQLTPDVIKIKDRRLSAIEYKSKPLETFMNQPKASPSEYSKENNELSELSKYIDLINQLRAK